MIRVFLLDDHPIVRAGMRALLSTAPDIEVVGEASDGHRVLRAARSPDWAVDLVVVDIDMPRISGLEVLRRLSRLRPDVAVLMLSMHDEAQYARRVIAMGAAGYVSKDRSEDELTTAIRTVAEGRIYLSQRVGFGPITPREAQPHETLSRRQHQIFSLLIAGRTVTDIAAELDLTVSTVSTHFGHVKQKLRVRTIADLMGYAHRMQTMGAPAAMVA